MGLPKQEVPVVDYESSSKGARAGKIVPIAQHWAEVGFGTPVILHLFYVVKILLYVLVAWLVVGGTSGIDAATVEFERGVVRVADMVTRQPWDDEVPVTVTWSDRLKA